MSQHSLTHRCELAMMEKRRLIGRAPQLFGEEHLVAGKEPQGATGLVHIERLTVRIVWAGADVMQFQVGERGHMNHAGGVGFQARRRQVVVREVHRQGRSFTRSKIARWIIWIWLRENPSSVIEAQAGHVTLGTPRSLE